MPGAFRIALLLVPMLSCAWGQAAASTAFDRMPEADGGATPASEEADPVQIVVQVPPETALALRRGGSEAREVPVAHVAGRLGLTLEAMHPRTDDPSLSRWFTLEVADPAAAAQVMERLEQTGEVDAAYVKPPDELP